MDEYGHRGRSKETKLLSLMWAQGDAREMLKCYLIVFHEGLGTTLGTPFTFLVFHLAAACGRIPHAQKISHRCCGRPPPHHRQETNFGELLLRDQKCAEKSRPSRQSSGRLAAATDFSVATFPVVMRNSLI